MDKKKIKKVVLAYSGGLDTSIIIPWLKENYNNCEVICVSGNVGQASELEGLEEKALKTGASKIYIEDLTEEFLQECVFPCVQAGALYEGYMLGTAFARPFIAKRVAEIALAEGADAICHGCTGKGNDQVRFELGIKAFAPDMPIIAPWREWSIKSRDEEIDYAEAHNIPLKISRETNYSKDKNIWHLSHEGMDLEDPANEPQYNKPGFLEMGVSPEQAPDEATYVTVHFESGVPTAVDGVEMNATNVVLALNKLGGANGIGLFDVVENRLVGMKSRGLYETPGGAILYHAHAVLETICVDKETQHYKALVAQKLGEIVYNDPEAMKKLANLVYPPVRQRCLGYLEKAEEVGYSAAAVDAPQLFEAGFEKDYDCILCVTAPEEERLRRIVLRDGISAEQAKLRMKNQKTEEEYRMRSDFVLNNGADDRPEETLAQILGKMGIR